MQQNLWLGALLMLLVGQNKGLEKSQFSPKVVELKDVLDQKYIPKFFNGTWITDDAFTYFKESSLYMYNVTSRESTLKLSNITTLDGGYQWVSFSSDGKYALYAANKKRIYRHSYECQYKILDLNTRNVTDLHGKDFLQLVEWLPGGHDLIFVKDNNLYFLNDDFQSTEALTKDGVKGVVFNGVADWVYEEEVFSTTKALWLSPDGKMLAYAKFDDTRVHDLSYLHYGSPGESQYPDVVTLKYPKAGTTNPTVELHLLTFDLGISFEIFPDKFNFQGIQGEAILTDVVWTQQNDLVVTWASRVQNESNTFRCVMRIPDSAADCTLILDISEDHGWVDLVSPVLSQDGASFLQILPRVQEDLRSYPQLVWVKPSGQEETLTQGRLSVTAILGWQQAKQVVFYQAVRASHSSESHVYMVQIPTRKTFCLSCDYEKPCSYARADFSKDFTYYALTCKGPGLPFVRIHVTFADNKPLLTWEDNRLLQTQLADLNLPSQQDIEVPLVDGYEALVRLHLPKQMDRSGRLKYPLLLNVYGGPGSNIISDRFVIDFHSYLVSKRHVVVVHIDARGSAYRSKDQEHAVYRNLGRHEIQDQIAIVKYLTERFQFIDKARVGIWGWSYGGFATSMVLATDRQNVFQCGVAVAPVTNFLYYDSIYTERYMGLPSDNESAYHWTDVSRKVDNFANKSFLLIHGTADDNVHFQQSMMLTQALEAKDIFFYQQIYPDQAHGLASFIHHVYHTMNHFWTDCLQLFPGTV